MKAGSFADILFIRDSFFVLPLVCEAFRVHQNCIRKLKITGAEGYFFLFLNTRIFVCYFFSAFQAFRLLAGKLQELERPNLKASRKIFFKLLRYSSESDDLCKIDFDHLLWLRFLKTCCYQQVWLEVLPVFAFQVSGVAVVSTFRFSVRVSAGVIYKVLVCNVV